MTSISSTPRSSRGRSELVQRRLGQGLLQLPWGRAAFWHSSWSCWEDSARDQPGMSVVLLCVAGGAGGAGGGRPEGLAAEVKGAVMEDGRLGCVVMVLLPAGAAAGVVVLVVVLGWVLVPCARAGAVAVELLWGRRGWTEGSPCMWWCVCAA